MVSPPFKKVQLLFFQCRPFAEPFTGLHVLHAEVEYESGRYGCGKERHVNINQTNQSADSNGDDRGPVDASMIALWIV